MTLNSLGGTIGCTGYLLMKILRLAPLCALLLSVGSMFAAQSYIIVDNQTAHPGRRQS